jgi:Recombinase
MGGHVPTAFDVRDRRLVVNEAEAELVRNIFRRFLADRLCTKLVQELSAAGHRTKRGRSFEKGVLYKLLHNRAYVGEVASSARSPIWADAERISRSYVSRILRPALLAPSIVERILDGRATVGLAQFLKPFPIETGSGRTSSDDLHFAMASSAAQVNASSPALVPVPANLPGLRQSHENCHYGPLRSGPSSA